MVAVVSVIAVWRSAGIVALAAITVAGGVTVAAITWRIAAAGWRGGVRLVRMRAEIGQLSRFSGWLLAWATVDRVLLSAELLLFGAVLGPAVAASFAMTSYVTIFAVGAGMLTTGALMPTLGGMLARSDAETARLVSLAKSLNARSSSWPAAPSCCSTRRS